MLVLEPKKRYTIEQIKHHRWMIVEVMDSPVIRAPSTNAVGGTAGAEPNEVVLRIMANIGIDTQKTKKSLKVSDPLVMSSSYNVDLTINVRFRKIVTIM